MRKDNCFYLGRISRKHSFKGEVVISLDTDEPELYQNMESVFVALGNTLVPFFIEYSLLQKRNKLRVKFEDINTQTEAEDILNSSVYLPLKFLPKLTGNKFYYHEIIGFKIVDIHKGEVGIIESVNDTTAQILLEIKNGDIEILFPLIDTFLKKIDRTNKEVLVEAPEGLLEMYLK
ncbi:MAG: ribosome maturation factor RimM [Flavobacteriaceae bacterium]|nr:ribosome maturation factor RimM [Flavobacteriaceae bacterium]